MQGKNFLYFLADEQGRSFYLDGSLVKVSNSPTPLLNTPEGWKELEISNQRNQKYFALDRDFVVPLSFVGDGGHIIRDQFFKKGIEAKVSLIILKQHLELTRDGSGVLTGYRYHYKNFYKGAIDFSNFSMFGPKVTVTIMEDGLPKLIKARENVTYEIDLIHPGNEYIRWDGVTLRQNAKYIVTNGTPENSGTGTQTLDLRLLAIEEITSIGARNEERKPTSNNPGSLWDTNEFFLITGSEDTQITVKWDFDVMIKLSPGMSPINPTFIRFNLFILDSSSSFSFVTLGSVAASDPVALYNHKHNLKGTATVSVPAGKKVVVTLAATQNGQFTQYIYDDDGEFEISYTYRKEITYVPVVTPEYLFKQLINKIGDGKYQAESAFLKTISHIKLTTGDGIRMIPGTKKVKTSLNAFFKSYDSDRDIALGMVGSVCRLEDKGFFINYSDPIPIGEVKNLKVEVAQDYIFNSLKIGSPTQDYNDVNGREEFNTTAEFLSEITRVTKQVDKVSDYRKDCYGAEFTRINLEGKNTTDSVSDNDIWMIATEKNISGYLGADNNKPVYNLDRALNPTATGLLEKNTVFNLELTPKRELFRIGAYLHSFFYKMDGSKLIFQTMDKNDKVASGSPLITEKADVPVGSLPQPHFLPIIFNFECPAPVDLIEVLDASPARAFSFIYENVLYVGIAMKVGIRADDHKAQEYQLLAGPSNNLELLITKYS